MKQTEARVPWMSVIRGVEFVLQVSENNINSVLTQEDPGAPLWHHARAGPVSEVKTSSQFPALHTGCKQFSPMQNNNNNNVAQINAEQRNMHSHLSTNSYTHSFQVEK